MTLPPFPAIEIDEGLCGDDVLALNTPLRRVVENKPHRDILAFQVDFWSSRGVAPHNMAQVETRQKEIQYSSRVRADSAQRCIDRKNMKATPKTTIFCA